MLYPDKAKVLDESTVGFIDMIRKLDTISAVVATGNAIQALHVCPDDVVEISDALQKQFDDLVEQARVKLCSSRSKLIERRETPGGGRYVPHNGRRSAEEKTGNAS